MILPEYKKQLSILFSIFTSMSILLYGLEINGVILISKLITSKIITIFTLGLYIFLIYYSIQLFSRRNYLLELKNLVLVFLLFLPISLLGPFIQPPSDPIYHSFILVNSNDTAIYKDVPNRAFLNKEIYELILSFSKIIVGNYKYINNILLFHSFSATLLIVSTYISSRLYGLNFKWSIVSVLLMILFFGTDRFSYFTYYSLAPSSINMAFFWLFTGILLHLTMKPYRITWIIWKKIGFIMFLGLSMVTIIYYNHHQEGGFFFFLYLLVGTILIFRMIHESRWSGKLKIISYSLILSIFFLPTYLILKIFNKLPMDLHLRVEEATEHLTNYHTIWIFGKLGGPRIWETLSFYGFAPFLFFIIYVLYCIVRNQKMNRKILLPMLPGLLTFWLMLVPSNIMIWIKAVSTNEHLWRMAYFSQYWFSIAYLFYLLERKLFRLEILRYLKTNYEFKKTPSQ